MYIELERPSDKSRSEPKEFIYIPSNNSYKPGTKRPRNVYDSSSYDSSWTSDELPVPIKDLTIDAFNTPNLLLPIIDSNELNQAANNINSDEFAQLFEAFGEDYLSCIEGDGDTTPPVFEPEMGPVEISCFR